MRTPAGKECSFFYGDYYRGRNNEECRLLKNASPSLEWKPNLCSDCPVPDIQMANACEFMQLNPKLVRSFPFTKQQVQVKTICMNTNRRGFDSHIGCGECHILPPIFTEKTE